MLLEDDPTRGISVFGRKTRDFLKGFSDYQLNELNHAPRTASGYVERLSILSRFVGKPAEQVTVDDAREFLRSSDYAPATKQSVIVALHQFHQWGALEGYWSLNGIMAIKTPKTGYNPLPGISHETARQLLDVCDTSMQFRVVYLGLYGGLRISESAQLEPLHWDRDRLRLEFCKGSKRREVPVHPELHKVRNKILQEQPSSDGVLQSCLKTLRDRVGAFDLWGRPATSHALRRTMATTLYNEGAVPYEVVGSILGHGPDVTARYVKVGFTQKAEAMGTLTYFGGQPIQLELFG